MGNGQTSPLVWITWVGAYEALGNGVCPACARIEHDAAMAGDARNPSVGNRLVVSGRRSFSEAGVAQAHTTPDARRRRWRGLQRRRQWCAGSPLGGPTPGRAAQSSTLRQRLPETPRSRSGYPLRPVAGCRPRGLGVRHPATTLVPRQAGCHGNREPRRARNGELLIRADERNQPELSVENRCRTGITRPAWGISAADRLETWSERSMHSGRAMQRRGAYALRLKASSGRQSSHSNRRTWTVGEGVHRLRRPVRAACEGLHTPRRQRFPRGRPSGDSVDPSGHCPGSGITPPGFYGRKPW